MLIDRPDSPQSMIVAAALTGLKGTDDLLPYNTANVVLGGDFLSRINMDLREAQALVLWRRRTLLGARTCRALP